MLMLCGQKGYGGSGWIFGDAKQSQLGRARKIG